MRRGSNLKIRLIIGAGIILFSLFKYYSKQVENPYTGTTQSIDLTVEQEIKLGLDSRGQKAQQHGGLHPNQELQNIVDQVGKSLVDNRKEKKIGN